jgi:hypothetical protein
LAEYLDVFFSENVDFALRKRLNPKKKLLNEE